MKTLEKISDFAGNTFAVWVILFGTLSLMFPEGFAWIAPHIALLLGIIMFGMGLTLTLDDFKGVIKAPVSVFVAVGLQYTVMPLVAFGLAIIFQLPSEIAAGVILVGCCPGGNGFKCHDIFGEGEYCTVCVGDGCINRACSDSDPGTDIAFCQSMAAGISG